MRINFRKASVMNLNLKVKIPSDPAAIPCKKSRLKEDAGAPVII